jgi:sialate O-acetylesterase
MKNKIILRGIFLICLLFSACPLFSKIVLPGIFSDNMVLQQQTDAPIWGKATPGKNVKLITSWDNQMYSAQADALGKWSIQIKTPLAGGPYFISISDGKELVLNNILIGEVWICSGQSNMEMPLAGWGQVLNYQEEITSADYPAIRLLHLRKVTAMQPQEDVKLEQNGWQVCSPSTVAEFSSVGYFFGRELNRKLNIPIGLINTSWGGTIAEAWTKSESLEYIPAFREAIQIIREQSKNENENLYENKLKEWEQQLILSDKGLEKDVPVWAGLALNEADWKTMQLPNLWEKDQLTDYDGIVWFRKTVDIPDNWEGKDLILNLGTIDDNDITYFNGKEIGSTVGYNMERIYTIPGKAVKKGKAIIGVRIMDTGGEGGIYGDPVKLSLKLKSNGQAPPLSLSGDWKYKPSVHTKDLPPRPKSPNDPNQVSVLYNAMIHPLVPYAIQGAIWYQGESNADRADQYRELFPLMIRDWRKAWKKDFPFYFVQLANFMERNADPQESEWARLREAQLQTLNLENTGMAVSIDIGDDKDIHPKNKQEVGRRLALAAEAQTYKQKIVFSGPIYQGYKIEGDKIRIQFQYAESGLKTNDGSALTGFAIAGPDHQFHWASALIEGNDVIVSSPEVKFPVAVRYAWANNPACNLYNKADLPASPFRTDDWK